MRSTVGRRLSLAVLLAAANLLWAGQGVAVKLLDTQFPPLGIALLPFFCITLVGFCILLSQPDFRRRCHAAWSCRYEFLLAGIAGQFLAQVGLTIGVSWSLASNGAILSPLIPVLSAVIATWLLCERLTALRIASLLIGGIGVLLLSPISSARSHGLTHIFAGNLLIVSGCLGSAFYNVYSKRLLNRFSDLEVLFFSYLATSICGIPLLIALDPHCLAQAAKLGALNWMAFGYLAFFVYGISMVLFLRALRSVDVTVASSSLYLIPLFGVILASMILKERLAPQAILGSAVVLLATLLLFRYDYSPQSLV